jgi:4-amino-4-deoxy-L-arabinose transferase-like glycosyltransferase
MRVAAVSLSLWDWLPYLWTRVAFPAAPPPESRIRWQSLLLVLALPALLTYPALGFHLCEPDEGRYAQIPREMLDRGAWVVPTLQGEPYLDKPPLTYWLVKLSYLAFGVSPAAARLVPALSIQLTVLAVYLIGRRSVGERAAFWAALLLSVSPGYVGMARLLVLDGVLVCCVTVSVLCGFEAVRTGRLKLGWWIASAVGSGLGFLTKGPVSEVLLFPPLFAFALLNRQTARVGGAKLLLFAAVVLAVNLPWYVAIYVQEPAFLRYFFWEQNVMRFLQPFDHLQPVWYYVPILLAGFWPGVVVGVAYLRGLVFGDRGDTPRTQAGGFWLLAGGWCLFFFSCSGSKLPTYILPAFPFLALAFGEFISRSPWDRARRTRLLLGGSLALCVVMNWAVVPWYAAQRSPVGPNGDLERVRGLAGDPAVPVVTYPRHLDSVAFTLGRADFDCVRSKEVNQFIVDCHFRPRTVVLFTHNHSYAAFADALPPSLTIARHETFQRTGRDRKFVDKLAGSSPWGLCDAAVIEPVKLQTR